VKPPKMKFITMFFIALISIFLASCSFTNKQQSAPDRKVNTENMDNITSSNLDTAVFGAGCFWCVEAIFQELNGVQSVESGYSGGTVENPSYQQVCSGTTGHAEVARIIFDPSVITYDDLLEVFWTTHDPTTLNQQGADVGEQYRSIIFYLNDAQKESVEKSKKEIAPKIWDDPIVTEIEPLKNFYIAEDYHQNYYNENSGQGYCKFVINPKLEKFRKKFKEKLKK
jgi:peptide-methionine (S)-S-oxide reductase